MAAHEMDHMGPGDKPTPGPGDIIRIPRQPGAVTAAMPPPALSSTPDAMSLLKALRRRWFLATALGVMLATVAGGAAYMLLPAKYFAFALLQVSSKNVESPFGATNRSDFTIYMKTAAERLKSRDVVMKALNQDGVRNLGSIRKHPDTLSAVAWIDENMKVEFKEGSELLNVTLTGEDANDLVVIVNALTKSYLSIISGQENSKHKEQFERYQKMHEDAKEVLSAKNAAKEALLRGQGAKDQLSLIQHQMIAQNRLHSAQERLAQHQYELDRKNTKIAALKKSLQLTQNQPVPEIPLRDVYETDLDLKKDVVDLLQLEKRHKYLLREGTPPNNATRRQTEQAIADIKERVEKRVEEVRADYADKARKRSAEQVEVQIAEILTEVAPLEGYIAKYVKDVEALSKEADAVNFWQAKAALLDSEIQQQEKAVAELFQAVHQARIATDSEARIAQIGEAEWQVRDSKKRAVMLLLVPFAALCCSVLGVAWWEFSARRIHGPDEVVAGLAMRVVGAVPELPDPRRKGVDPQAAEMYRHNLIESIDAIRTMLLRNANTENLRVIMVTSAVAGEGKTTLASNLAMSLARAGRKTLLVDCDLRRPASHQLFEQTLQPGFSEVVLHEVELPDAVRPTTTDENLFLLPAGHWDREVIQELAKPGVISVFERLRQEFDFIIVDSHPVLPATDSLLIAQNADAVIVSLMRDVSQMHHVHQACQQLSTLGIKVFGAVVNGVPVKVYGKTYQATTGAAA